MDDRRAQAVRDHWVREDFLEDLGKYATQHERVNFRNKWECEGEKKGLYSRVKWEVDKVQARMDEDLERRRNRLAELLRAEEEMYSQETVPLREDSESKYDRMLSRYKELKVQKEMDRQVTAEEKREQQFKRNCGELRTMVSKKIQRETTEEGRQLILEKRREAEAKNKEEDAMFCELWIRDSELKRRKEEKEEESKKKRNLEYGKYVTDQMLEKKLECQKKLRYKEEDAEIMAEQKRLLGLEEEWAKEMKKRKQETVKRDLDECLRAKLRQRAQEVQDDLMQDIFFLKQIVEDDEEVRKNEKKRALMKEQQLYLKYLQDQARKEADFEKEIDRVCQEELDKMWARRRKEWDEEKKKRRQMEGGVMKGVKDQIMANMEKGRQLQTLNDEYAQKVLEEDEEDRRRAKEILGLIRKRNAQNQKELLEQIRIKEKKLEQEKRQRDKELELLRKGRDEEEAKIRKLLSEMEIENKHPYRVCRRDIFNDCGD